MGSPFRGIMIVVQRLGGRNRKQVFKLSNPTSSDTLPPMGPRPRNLPKECYQLGTKHSNTIAYEGHISFKPSFRPLLVRDV